MGLLKHFDLTDFPDGYVISPGSIATSPTRIYIPAINTGIESSRMIIYDYGGNDLNTNGERKEPEEFRLKYTEGIIYGGATWYNGGIWVVSDEQVESEFTGCVENYSVEGQKIQSFGLPWMWGYEDFKCLGITVEKNFFYILTKRIGWFDNEELKESKSNTYHIEKYNINGNFERKYRLHTSNADPIGLTDNEINLVVGDKEDNQAYYYDDMINLLSEDLNFVPDTDNPGLDNSPEHGIGYNGASFSVLRDSIPYRVFIYGDGNVIPDGSIQPINRHGDSLVTRVNEVFSSLGQYGRNYKIENKENGEFYEWAYPKNDDKEGEVFESIEMYQGSAVDFLTSTNLENKVFKNVDYLKFIPQYTLPGLKLGDIIVDDGHDRNQDGNRNNTTEGNMFDDPPITSNRFEIIDFKEVANGQLQVIFAQRIS